MPCACFPGSPWAPLEIERTGGDIRFTLESNWALAVLRKTGGSPLVTFGALPPMAAGGEVKLDMIPITGTDERLLRIKVFAPGLGISPVETAVPGATLLQVPTTALPGNYAVRAGGDNVLGTMRFLVVPPS